MGVIRNGIQTATAYSTGKRLVRTSKGVLWYVGELGASNYQGWYSTDNGVTWSQNAGAANTYEQGSGSYTAEFSYHLDQDDNLHIVYTDCAYKWVYYQRATLNAAHTALTWGTQVLQYSVANGVCRQPDIVGFRNPVAGGWTAVMVWSQVRNSTEGYVCWNVVDINSAGTVTRRYANGTVNAISGNTGNNMDMMPSIDFRHNGDGKTVALIGGVATPDLFFAWTQGNNGNNPGIFTMKYVWSATGQGVWNASSAPRNTGSNLFWQNGASGVGFFDGVRHVIAGGGLRISDTSYFMHVFERDVDDTAYVLTGRAYSGADPLYSCSPAYDDAKNVYIVGRSGDSAQAIKYRKWNRSDATLASPVTLDATTNGNGASFPTARRQTTGQSFDVVYTDFDGNSTYPLTTARVQLNQAPTAATWVTADNTTVNSSAAIPLSFKHNDPDGDAASYFQVRARAAGTTGAWQTFGSTVITDSTGASVTVTGSTTAANGATITYSIPADTVGGVLELQVRTFDPANTAGAWSSSISLLALPSFTAGGVGGSSLSFMQLYTMCQSERALRALSLA